LAPIQRKRDETAMNENVQSYVAVVTVHGVGDQVPHRTTQEVTDLLLGVRRDGGGTQYTPFEEATVQVGTNKVDPGDEVPGDHAHNFIRELLEKGWDGSTVNPKGTPGEPFETMRCEGARLDDQNPPQPKQGVHIYEMYWADLTGIGTGLFRVLEEFFHLLFHMGDVGRQTARIAGEKSPDWFAKAVWRWVERVQVGAVWLLTCPIAVLNLYEFAIGLLVVIKHLDPIRPDGTPTPFAWAIPWLAVTLGGVIVLVLMGRWIFHLGRRLNIPWSLWLIIPLAAGITAALFLVVAIPEEPKYTWHFRLLSLEWCVIVMWLIYRLLRLYVHHRGGSGAFSAGAGIFFFSYFLFWVWWGSEAMDHVVGVDGVVHAGVRAIELIYPLIMVCWISLVVLIGLQAILLIVVLVYLRVARYGHFDQMRRAAETVILLLITPTTLFRILTLGFWGVFWIWSKPLIPSVHFRPLMPMIPPFSHLEHVTTAYDFVEGMLNFSATSTFNLMLGVIAAALGLSIWALFPAVWADIRDPFFNPKDPAQAAGGTGAHRSVRLGRWLDHGYGLLWFAGLCVFVAVPILFGVGLYSLLFLPHAPGDHQGFILAGFSISLSSVIVLLLSVRGTLENLGLGFRTAVRVALDVDNYMREFPREATPRSRIFCRYASLLRYLCNWRDSRGRGYRAIVIIAHSQGTVITVDLLRFLKRQKKDSLVRELPPVYLLTAGSPLRQLYGWRFPHLYEWAYHSEKTVNPMIPTDLRPDPRELVKVKRWVNLYRSGDYVGRFFWGPLADGKLWFPGLECADDGLTRLELCINAGSHNHYFDADGAEVGKRLDELITAATVTGVPWRFQ
jgi:hypothetical protein